MKKKAVTLLLSLYLLLAAAVSPAYAAAQNPSLSGVPGTWAPGATPPNLNPNAPVVLFVQGLTGSAGTWYNNNDMYQTAYNNGYQTAFVELYDSAGTPKSMWDNGQLLAGRIADISNYFHKKVAVVAHSKGGVDTQTALVHYNAYPYVSNVVTLSSPHHGSELADLAYSSWAGWLASLIGYHSDGAYSMQTSYMNYFRSITDSNPNAMKNKFYTFAGNDWASGSAAYFAGGAYLSLFGPNDGVVTVSSANIPNGTMIKVGSWNHQSIRTGSKTFSLFKPYLTNAGISLLEPAKDSARPVAIASASTADNELAPAGNRPQPQPQPQEAGNILVRGGSHDGNATEAFYVENDVRTITLTWIADQKLDELTLVSPGGTNRKVQVTASRDEEGVFRDAWVHTAVVKKPEQGQWRVKTRSERPGAYLLTVGFDSELNRSLKLKAQPSDKEGRVRLDSGSLPSKDIKLRYSVNFASESRPHSAKGEASRKLIEGKGAAPQEDLIMPRGQGPGVYNMSVDVNGVTDKGARYERTLIRSVYEDEQGERH